jgi:hypothetical protein
MWVDDIDIKYLKMDNLKDGNLYDVYSRDSYLGHCVAYYKGDGSFSTVNLGNKDWNFTIRKEIHWDADKRYGTVKPVRDLGKCPSNLSRDKLTSLLAFLSKPIWKKDGDDEFAEMVAGGYVECVLSVPLAERM